MYIPLQCKIWSLGQNLAKMRVKQTKWGFLAVGAVEKGLVSAIEVTAKWSVKRKCRLGEASRKHLTQKRAQTAAMALSSVGQ